MDKIASVPTAIEACVMPTIQAYFPLLMANSSAIKATPVSTHSYGPLDRHNLDVYQPTNQSHSSSSSPILLFVHGGGFVQGSKTLPEAQGLIYANVGHFFAETAGYTTVIIDYRLIEHGARFPSGGEDVALAVRWIAENLAQSGTQRDLYLLGNSAGGVHTGSFLLAPDFAETRKLVLDKTAGVRLVAAVQLGVPFDFRETAEGRADTLNTYYGSPEGIARDEVLELLKRAQPAETELKDVRFMVAGSELDPPEIMGPEKSFVEAWKGGKPELLHIKGHNHISVMLGLGTAVEREEKWGRDVLAWLEQK